MADAANGDEGAKVLQVARRDDGEGDSRCRCGFFERLQSVDDEACGRRARDLIEHAEVDCRNILALGRETLKNLPESVLHDLVEMRFVEGLCQSLVPLLHLESQVGQLR